MGRGFCGGDFPFTQKLSSACVAPILPTYRYGTGSKGEGHPFPNTSFYLALLSFVLMNIPPIHLLHAIFYLYFVVPAEVVEFGNIGELAEGTIGFVGVEI